MRLLSALVLLALVLVGCGPSADNQQATFEALEDRLLSAESFSLDFHVTAEGVIEANLEGSLRAASSGQVELEARGTFLERELEMHMVTDGDSLRMTTTELSDAVALPAEVYEALAIGLTRMGILHNLASLSTVTEPEHSEVGIGEWVTVGEFGTGTAGEHDGVSFGIFVEGQRTSGAVLAILDGIPVERTQIVDFPGGAMTVRERYTDFAINPR